MTSRSSAFIWIWLPGTIEPVVAGRIDRVDLETRFTYGQSYLARNDAIALQPEGMDLRAGTLRPPLPLEAHGVIRDAAPDSWGMRVIARRLGTDQDGLTLIDSLLESGSDRIGALDVQASADHYEARRGAVTLEEVVTAGERVARGEAFSPVLDEVLTYGTAIGGARPKALVDDGGRPLIAKFSVSTDVFPWIEAEAVGMELARRCGVQCASCNLTTAADRDVILIERFDRSGDERRHMLSALTLLGLHELMARHGTYVELADRIRLHFVEPEATVHELFRRLVVNVLVGNTDDHPRNHAAFWDGRSLRLTPAFDVSPQPRSPGEAEQLMAYSPDGEKRSRLATCIAASSVFLLSTSEAREIVDDCSTVVLEQYGDVCDALAIRDSTRVLLWRGAVANDSIFYDSD
jgi:serine/threonine-protein kinase HipA